MYNTVTNRSTCKHLVQTSNTSFKKKICIAFFSLVQLGLTRKTLLHFPIHTSLIPVSFPHLTLDFCLLHVWNLLLRPFLLCVSVGQLLHHIVVKRLKVAWSTVLLNLSTTKSHFMLACIMCTVLGSNLGNTFPHNRCIQYVLGRNQGNASSQSMHPVLLGQQSEINTFRHNRCIQYVASLSYPGSVGWQLF